MKFSSLVIVFCSSVLLWASVGDCSQIADLSERARATGDAFLQQSQPIREAYEFEGGFADREDREDLRRMAGEAVSILEEIESVQRALKSQMESYSKSDWDDKFGQTGAWAGIVSGVHETTVIKCQINYYLAEAVEGRQREEILKQIIEQINSLEKSTRSDDTIVLKAKATCLLCESDISYKPSALYLLNGLGERFDEDNPLYYRVGLERLKFTDMPGDESSSDLTGKFLRSACSGDVEVAVSLGLLDRRVSDRDAIEKVVAAVPASGGVFGRILIGRIADRVAEKKSLSGFTVFEAELGVQAALGDSSVDISVLESLSGHRDFQTPLVLYTTAIRLAESEPEKAVDMLIRASQKRQRSNGAEQKMDLELIARQGGQLAYNLFLEDNSKFPIAKRAIENYLHLAGAGAEAEMEYLYVSVLDAGGEPAKSKQVLRQIADRGNSFWSRKAKFDVIVDDITNEQAENQVKADEGFGRLREFILGEWEVDKRNNQLRVRAIRVYCMSLLAMGESEYAREVLSLLDEAADTSGVNASLFRAKALQQLSDLAGASRYMLEAIMDDSGSLGPTVLELVGQINDRIDDYDGDVVEDVWELARFSYKTVKKEPRSTLIFSEISILRAGGERVMLSEVEGLLDGLENLVVEYDIDYLRCRARLLTCLGEYGKAAYLWGRIAGVRKGDMKEDGLPTWKWWRARYFELYCLGEQADCEAESLLHTIEVLESSYSSIPSPWGEKIEILKPVI